MWQLAFIYVASLLYIIEYKFSNNFFIRIFTLLVIDYWVGRILYDYEFTVIIDLCGLLFSDCFLLCLSVPIGNR